MEEYVSFLGMMVDRLSLRVLYQHLAFRPDAWIRFKVPQPHPRHLSYAGLPS